MVLELKKIFVSEGACLPFDDSIDLSGVRMTGGEAPFRERVRVRGRVCNHAGVISLTATAFYRYFTRCDRCFQDIVEPGEVFFENTLVPSLSNEGDEGQDGGLLVVKDEKLDVGELAEANVILNLPMKHLCSPGCKGLCPVCGKNLNEGPCGCAKEKGDPRLAALKNFLK